MESLRVKYGMEICLRNKHSMKYFEFDTAIGEYGAGNASAPPPSIHNSKQRMNYNTGNEVMNERVAQMMKVTTYSKYRIVAAKQTTDTTDTKDYVCYGSKVHLINEHGQYLMFTSTTKEGLKFERPPVIEDSNTRMFYKCNIFIVNDVNNGPLVNKRPITVYDDIVIKNVHSNFLICLQNHRVNMSGTQSDTSSRCLWNIMKADVPYIPQWVYYRDTFNKFMNLQLDREKVVLQSARTERRLLSSQSPLVQQILLIEDILDVMLGFEGVYIKKRPNSHAFQIEYPLQTPTCSMALAQLAQKILFLPAHYYVIENYISTYSLQQGTVCQALCGGLRQLIKEYKMMVVQLDEEASREGLTLQKMWFYVQSSMKIMKSLFDLVKEAQHLKGGQLISCIMKMLHNTTDENIVNIYNYLFAKTLKIYIELISKWIYEGIIEDKHQEFLITADDNQWSSWEDRYCLRGDQVPTLFEKHAHLILVTGKYLNIMKACNKMPEHPFRGEIETNMDKSMKQQDFTESIKKAYEWASQQLLALVFKEYQLVEVLKSMKGYFFMEFGDFFVHFMELAQEDLLEYKGKKSSRKGQPVSVQKLQNLFQLLIRTSSANNDPFKDDISCRIDTISLYQQVQKIKTTEPKVFQFDHTEKLYMKIESRQVDYFTLDYKCEFPLNLIINKRTIAKYQVIFRYLFWSKFTEHELNSVWLALQSTRDLPLEWLRQAYLLNQKMINYTKNLVYYLSYETIEHNWLNFLESLKKVKTFQEIIKYHDDFLNQCLTQSLLVNKTLLPIITVDLGNVCQGFLSVRAYLQALTDKTQQFIINPNDSILVQRKKRKEERMEKIDSLTQVENMKLAVKGFSQKFDYQMKKLLRQVYSMVGKQQNYLVGFLDRLDQEKYYNRHYFQNTMGGHGSY